MVRLDDQGRFHSSENQARRRQLRWESPPNSARSETGLALDAFLKAKGKRFPSCTTPRFSENMKARGDRLRSMLEHHRARPLRRRPKLQTRPTICTNAVGGHDAWDHRRPGNNKMSMGFDPTNVRKSDNRGRLLESDACLDDGLETRAISSEFTTTSHLFSARRAALASAVYPLGSGKALFGFYRNRFATASPQKRAEIASSRLYRNHTCTKLLDGIEAKKHRSQTLEGELYEMNAHEKLKSRQSSMHHMAELASIQLQSGHGCGPQAPLEQEPRLLRRRQMQKARSCTEGLSLLAIINNVDDEARAARLLLDEWLQDYDGEFAKYSSALVAIQVRLCELQTATAFLKRPNVFLSWIAFDLMTRVAQSMHQTLGHPDLTASFLSLIRNVGASLYSGQRSDMAFKPYFILYTEALRERDTLARRALVAQQDQCSREHQECCRRRLWKTRVSRVIALWQRRYKCVVLHELWCSRTRSKRRKLLQNFVERSAAVFQRSSLLMSIIIAWRAKVTLRGIEKARSQRQAIRQDCLRIEQESELTSRRFSSIQVKLGRLMEEEIEEDQDLKQITISLNRTNKTITNADFISKWLQKVATFCNTFLYNSTENREGLESNIKILFSPQISVSVHSSLPRARLPMVSFYNPATNVLISNHWSGSETIITKKSRAGL